MNVLTLAQLRPTIARVLGVCQTDSRVRDVINESQQRLINKGDWAGVFMRYRVCTSESCLVWPRQILNIEAFAICKTPGKVRNEWFEFLGTGYGLPDDDDYIGKQLLSTGHSVTFDWVRGSDSYVRIYAMSSTDAGKTITIKYLDDDAQKVYTKIDGNWQEGEQITLVAPPAYAVTANKVKPNGIYAVTKDVTNLPVILYEYDGVSNTRTLAQYEPRETHPIYKMTFMPNLRSTNTCAGSTDSCDKRWVTVMARVRHIDVWNENDPLVLGNIAAFKLMAMAIKEEESRNNERSLFNEQRALGELNDELTAHLGQGAVVAPKFEDPALFGGGGIYSLMD